MKIVLSACGIWLSKAVYAIRALDPQVAVQALLSVAVLAALAFSLLALLHSRSAARSVRSQWSSGRDEWDAALREMESNVNGLAAQVHDLQQQPAMPPAPLSPPKPGLNLTNRSQALRMFRRGESPEQIAKSLEVPRQEIDLLLKVHRLVIRNL